MIWLTPLLYNGKKKYTYPSTRGHLPKGEDISYHTAEVLWQAENSVVVSGGWVGGDYWFGSIELAVELKCILNLHSTFIITQYLNHYPMKVLHSILTSRHGSRHMQATIGGVNLYVMVYAWSTKGIAYMVSTCGKTVMHLQPYIFCFEDEYGNVQEKELP
jgi:hypothetical protein